MPKERLLHYITNCKDTKRIYMQIAMQCAPLLKGLKEACICIVPNQICGDIIDQMDEINIKCLELYQGQDRSIIYLYKKELLLEYLSNNEVQDFLLEYGYSTNDFDQNLIRLSLRMEAYYGKKVEFPHEIGAFLGYPIKDVKGFIQNKGQNYLLSGYWKVYQDKQKSRNTFKAFDRAKEIAAKEILLGKRLSELIV